MSDHVTVKGPAEVQAMRVACRLAARTLREAGKLVKPGITTDDINSFVHTYTIEHNATPAPLNYRGFPKSVCTSIKPLK